MNPILLLLLVLGGGWAMKHYGIINTALRLQYEPVSFRFNKVGVVDGIRGEVVYQLVNPSPREITIDQFALDIYIDEAKKKKLTSIKDFDPITVKRGEQRIAIPFHSTTATLLKDIGPDLISSVMDWTKGTKTLKQALASIGEGKLYFVGEMKVDGKNYPINYVYDPSE